MTELYSPEELARLRKKHRIWTAALWVFGLAALAVCVILCCRTTVHNAEAMLKRIILVSTLCGWTLIALRLNLLRTQRREIVHIEHMLHGVRETDTGEVTVTDQLHIIPKSAPLLRAYLRDGVRERELFVSPRKAKALGPTPRRMRVQLVYGCIAAWEAADEDA